MKIIDKYLESIFPMDSWEGADKLKKKQKAKAKKINFNMSADKDEDIEDIANKHTYTESNETHTEDRIMVDFDGVIHSYEKGFHDGSIYGELNEGTKEAIDTFRELGLKITIFTTRASVENNGKEETKKMVSEIESWLKERDIYFDEITSEKLAAIAYIDDRGIRFEGDWSKITNKIKTLLNA